MLDRITIDELRKLCEDKTIMFTDHARIRCQERGLRYSDLKAAVLSGEIIEQYPTDYPYPSCLVLGTSVAERQMHVVCGIGCGFLWFITAYYPDPAKWEPGFKTRKGN